MITVTFQDNILHPLRFYNKRQQLELQMSNELLVAILLQKKKKSLHMILPVVYMQDMTDLKNN